MLGLRWMDIELSANAIIYIRGTVTCPDCNQPMFAQNTKTDKSRRIIRLAEPIKPFLAPGVAEAFVVGGDAPFSYRQVRRMCGRIQKDMRFEQRIIPNRFRTVILTDLYDITKDIRQTQAAVRHTSAQ
ncbi:MAG: hypothetical protein SOV75_09540 [Candidatus Limiplasma sp.]|nr:hypothetical protein [Candidatus Limiplasma sp.]